jgi:hypothetical protein
VTGDQPAYTQEETRQARERHLASDCPALLPRHVAQVAHALLEAATQAGGGPLKASEVMIYDRDALTIQATATALYHAMRRRLADRGGTGLWMPTNAAWDMRKALEHYVLVTLEGTG